MIERKKWAIAGSGGGMRCVEGAGVRYKLAELGYPHPDIEVNISGNIPNALYCMAGKHHLGWDIWTRDLPGDPELINWQREGSILSVDQMVDKHFAVPGPLGLTREEIFSSHTRVFAATTHHATKRTKFFVNEDMQSGVDPLEVIRAGTAYVGLTRKWPVKINGERYSDGALSTSLKDCIQVAFDAGAEFVVAIDSRTDEERKTFAEEFASSGWSDKVALLQPESKAVMVTTNRADMEQSFYAGCKAVMQHPLLQRMFAGTMFPVRAQAA